MEAIMRVEDLIVSAEEVSAEPHLKMKNTTITDQLGFIGGNTNEIN